MRYNRQHKDYPIRILSSSMERITIDVKGMSCSGCESRVEKALSQTASVKRVDADHIDGTIEVVAESEDEVRQVTHDAGYEVTG